MPEYEVSVPLQATFSARVKADTPVDARLFAEALANHVLNTEGLLDTSIDVARELGLDASVEEFSVNDIPFDATSVEEVE